MKKLFRKHKYKVKNYQLSTKYSQTGLSSQVSSESRHHWQLHTPVSDILDSEKLQNELLQEDDEENERKKRQKL